MIQVVAAILLAGFAHAQSKMTLQQYLDDVKTRNPQAIAHVDMIRAYEGRLDLGETATTPQAYLKYNLLDDRKPTQMPQMMGDRTKNTLWRLGVKDQTDFGLAADLYLDTSDTRVWGASSTFMPLNPYRDTRAVLELKQSLWRNSFGEQTRAEKTAARKGAEAQLEQEKFSLSMMLMEAENTYWQLASYNEIVKLQQENVDRARKLRDYMKKRAGMRLFDDVDYLQAQAGFESRELEYRSSIDERSTILNKFNTLRYVNARDEHELQPLPTEDWRKSVANLNQQKRHRGDFNAKRAAAEAQVASARASFSKIRPELDLVASVATTGRDTEFPASAENAQDFDHPTYMIGVNFSIGLDIGLLHRLKSSYGIERTAAQREVEYASFEETREWQNAIEKKQEAIDRYDRSVNLEKLYGEIIKRERQRLLNGRTTTFQLLKLEQDFAGIQTQRVRTQLGLLQLHNALKLFGE